MYIIKKLILNNHLSFSNLMEKQFRSNLFNYHLKWLIQNGFVIKNIVDEKNLDKNRTYAVGNSAGSDITPAILNGLFAIYLPVSTWKYEREKPLPKSDRIFVFENGITEIQKNYQRLRNL